MAVCFYFYNRLKNSLNKTVLPASDERRQTTDKVEITRNDKTKQDLVTLAKTTVVASTSSPITEDDSLSFEKEDPLNDPVVKHLQEERRALFDTSSSPIAARFRERRHLLETGCSSMTPLDLVLNWHPKPWYLVSESPPMIGCAPPRTGSHEWIHMFRQLDHLPDVQNATQEEQEVIDFAEKLPVGRGDGLLVSTAATRFLVVRHPFARLHAVWKALFSTVTDEGEKMFNKYSIGRYEHSQEDEILINFPDFCEFVADDSQARSEPLLRPLTGVCDPCSNPFDFVAKFETLTQDANWLLERAASNLTFPEHQEDTELWQEAWVEVLSSKKQVAQKLHQLYYWDFRLFGYKTEM